MAELYEYDSIRPYLDEEVPTVVARLSEMPELRVFLSKMLPEEQTDELLSKLKECRSVTQFKETIGYPVVRAIAEHTTFSVSLSGAGRLGGDLPTTFVTNHRDIILDSAFLNILMYERGYIFPRIAIGDNLFGLPWIEPLVKLNDSFVVRRSLPIRQMLLAAQTLSQFIDKSINEDHRSVWIAQREGRAKDNTDLTQPSILKMIASADGRHPIAQLQKVNIAPATISYEYDPCDILKACELLTKAKNPDQPYIKAKGEDLLNMKTGLMGQKGRVHIAIGTRLNDLLTAEVITEIETLPKHDQYSYLARLLDQEIHRNYRLYPINYIAFDRLHPDQTHPEGLYSKADETAVDDYIAGQIESVANSSPHNADELRTKLYEMYAQPLINSRQVTQ